MDSIKKTKGGTWEASKCWSCHYALNIERVCPWADHLEPREDWEAIYTECSSGFSFNVINCPGYLRDREYKEVKENEAAENEKLPDMWQSDIEED